jgi:hypothetical protein
MGRKRTVTGRSGVPRSSCTRSARTRWSSGVMKGTPAVVRAGTCERSTLNRKSGTWR